MSRRVAAFLGAGILSVVLTASAEASLIGREMSVEYRYPDLATVYPLAVASHGTFTIGAGEETQVLVEDVTTIRVDFGADVLSIVFDTVLPAPTWNVTSFNGVVFTATLPHGLIGASVSSTTMTGFGDDRVTLTGDEIRLNWNGLSYVDGTRIDIAFVSDIPVPEPGSLGLLAASLLGQGAVARRRALARA